MRGVETVRFWLTVTGIAVLIDAGICRGGLGGGIFSVDVAVRSNKVLAGRAGIIGRVSPVIFGVKTPLADPFNSASRSLRLLAVAGCCGGGCAVKPTWYILAFPTGSLGGPGLRGSAGGDSSPKLAHPLLGGLLNGETLSGALARATSRAPSPIHDLLLKAGLSRLARGRSSRCRRSSADLRGGGGEGGLKAGLIPGDLPRSLLEVRGGALNGFAGAGGNVGLTTSSGFNRLWSLAAKGSSLDLGGESGGSILSSGASILGRGVNGGGGPAMVWRAGERGSWPLALVVGGARPGFFGIGGGSFAVAGWRESRGRGLGEVFRLDGWVVWAGCGWSLPIFSKCDNSEETGFCRRISQSPRKTWRVPLAEGRHAQ